MAVSSPAESSMFAKRSSKTGARSNLPSHVARSLPADSLLLMLTLMASISRSIVVRSSFPAFAILTYSSDGV